MPLHQGPLACEAWFGMETALNKELRALAEKNLSTAFEDLQAACKSSK
ncbi:MAG: hypothetical protein WB821_10730 [Burkholderiaceae bacterium]